MLVSLPACSTAPLERPEVVRARGPVQAEVSARLDRLGLPVLGVEHGAVCAGGQDNPVVRDDFELMCAVREVRVAALSRPDLEQARAEADAALKRICRAGGRAELADDQSMGLGTLRGAFTCGDVDVDVLLRPPGSQDLPASSLFAASPLPGSISPPPPVGLQEAQRAGVPYVLLVLGRQEFYRKPR